MLGWIAFLVTACVTEGNYVTPISERYCKRLDECAKGDFDSAYSGLADCVDDVRTPWDEFRDCAREARCNFDPDQARRCEEEIALTSCENFVQADWLNACDQIYQCSFTESIEAGVCSFGWGDD
jgi:hypothetical protein